MGSAILAFSSSSLAWEDWDFLELPDDLLRPDSLLLDLRIPLMTSSLSEHALLNHL